jgi:hypothetical protein
VVEKLQEQLLTREKELTHYEEAPMAREVTPAAREVILVASK